MIRLALLAALAAFIAAPAGAAEPRAVLELFTSQGCSVSPKADKLAAELARKDGLLVLTFAVDYWDYLGWKDTFGSPAHTARQRAYATARGDRKVFTPQMVVNGTASATGSDRSAVLAAVDETAQAQGLSVPIEVAEADAQIDVSLSEGEAQDSEVWLVAAASHRTVRIDAGENKSRTVNYTNVVRKMTRLGPWNGKPARFTVPRADAIPADADRYFILVQEGSGSMPGRIIGVHAAQP